MTTQTAPRTSTQTRGLHLPALVEARIHQSRAVPQPMSFTDTTPLWLADMDRPLRLSRWTHPFGHRERPRFAVDALAETKNRIIELAACESTAHRVIMLADPSGTSAPAAPLSVFWCLDDADAVVATVAEIHHRDGHNDVFVATASPATTGTLTAGGTAFEAHGNLRGHLAADRVAVGLQLFDTAGTPLVTVSLAGKVQPASVRSLLSAAARAENSPRLAAV